MGAQMLAPEQPPLVVFEDDHLLVVHKPAGLNTHAPSPFAGEGIYDWLRHREPRWAALAIIHRLDKETSGVLVFGKTPEANRSLTEQFTARTVRKKYLLLTDRPVPRAEFTVRSALVRSGEKYLSRPLHAGAAPAETRFRVLSSEGGLTFVQAEPLTGRTHQIRAQAADKGFPVIGDTLYGGAPAPRLHLHSERIVLWHPVTRVEMVFHVPAEFGPSTLERGLPRPGSPDFARWKVELALARRASLIAPQFTSAYRILHGSSDAWPGWYVDRLGDYLLSQSERPLIAEQTSTLEELLYRPGPTHSEPDRTVRAVYDKRMERTGASPPSLLLGEAAPERFLVRENGLGFELSFSEGGSTGLFLDQRDNRRRLLLNHVAANFPVFQNSASQNEVLNTFAYTCGFSVCAAKAGARTTSLDLSRKYLEWGQRNFALNQIDPARHDFIHGDVFDWLRRFAKKERRFNVIVLDPPTFSRSKEHGVFQAERDCGKLVMASLPVLRPGGVLFASTNAATWKPEDFVAVVSDAVRSARRKITQQHYVPQPPDFPVSRDEPGYLKTLWVRID